MNQNDFANQNRFAAAFSDASELGAALVQCCLQINEQLSATGIQSAPDLVLVFVAGHSKEDFESSKGRVAELTDGKIVLGVTSQSLVAGGRELENAKGVSMWAACLPHATLTPMTLEFESQAGETSFVGLPEDGWESDSSLLMFSEPYSFPSDGLLANLNTSQPGVQVFGGVADPGNQPGEARLWLDQDVYASGAVAVRISGAKIRTIVSQGCRPIGETYIVTDAERNVIGKLGGQAAFDAVKEIYATLSTQDQRRVESGLHIGIAMTELKDRFQYGDFLIRNVIDIDETLGSISIGDFIRKGRTVQFHIRDQASASKELETMLESVRANLATDAAPEAAFTPAAALVFTCNGRGMNLFESPHHDASMVQKAFGDIPAAGFFAAGEFGYVGNANFLHGFTASIALFE